VPALGEAADGGTGAGQVLAFMTAWRSRSATLDADAGVDDRSTRKLGAKQDEAALTTKIE
jgi:hypothetical protein